MSTNTQQLLDCAIAEITQREATYFDRFAVSGPEGGGSETAAYYSRHGIRFDCADGLHDPVAELLANSAADAEACAGWPIPLYAGSPDASAETALLTSFDCRHTGSGQRYFIRRSGGQPLLLVSALGVPISVWSKFLADELHDFRIIVPEMRCGDLFAGGMNSDAALTQHAADLQEVLDHAGSDPVHLLAWCNGGRIALDLASRSPNRVRSLTLISTTLRATSGIAPATSPFEDGLQQIFSAIVTNPALAKPLVTMLSRFSKPPQWDVLHDPRLRAAALFAMPPAVHATALLAPMRTPEFLINYGRRTAADEAYPMADALSALRQHSVPTLLVTGEHDSIVSNAATRSALDKYLGPIAQVVVKGAGHYTHDLQYAYFMWILRNFTERSKLPFAPARLIVTPSDGCHARAAAA